MDSRLSHRETLSAAASALNDIATKSSDPMASSLRKAAIALEKAEKRIDALEIVVRKLAKDVRATDFEAQATRNSWPKSELQDLLR